MGSRRKRSRNRGAARQQPRPQPSPSAELATEGGAAALPSRPALGLPAAVSPRLAPLLNPAVAIPVFLVLLAFIPILLAEGFTGAWRVNQDLLHYAAAGLSVSRGDGLYFPDGETPFTIHGPVLPMLLGFFWAVFGFSYDAMVWGMRVFGVAGIVSAFFLGRKFAGTLGGFVFGLLMAVSPIYVTNIFFTRFLDALGVTFIVTGTLIAVHAFERRNAYLALGAGTVLALACLTKETFILMLVLPLLLSAAIRPADRAGGRFRLDAGYWRTLAFMLIPVAAIYGTWAMVAQAWAGQDVTHTGLSLGAKIGIFGAGLAVLAAVAVRPPRQLERIPALALQGVVFAGALLLAAAGFSAVGFERGSGSTGTVLSYLNSVDDHVLPFPVMLGAVAVVAVFAWHKRDRVTFALLLSLVAVFPIVVHASRLGLGYRQVMGPATLTFLVCGIAVAVVAGWLRRLPVWGSGNPEASAGPTRLVLAGVLLLLAVPVLESNRSNYETRSQHISFSNPELQAWVVENVPEGSAILIRPTLGSMLFLHTEGAYSMHWFPEQTLVFDGDEPSGFRPAASVFGFNAGTFGPGHYERGERLVALTGGGEARFYSGISDALLYDVISDSGASIAIDILDSATFLTLVPGVDIVQDLEVYTVLSIDQDRLAPLENPPLVVRESVLESLLNESGWDRDTLLARIAPNGVEFAPELPLQP